MVPALIAAVAVLGLAGSRAPGLMRTFGAGGPTAQSGRLRRTLRTIMPIVVSILVVAAGLYVILAGGYEDSSQQWAYGAVGAVLGYWLRPTDED